MSLHRSSARASLVLLCILCISMALPAQEAEPNDSCQLAQSMGTPDLPFTLFGSLDALSEGFDIDFFRFVMEAGTEVVVRLEGESTGQGTLLNPLAALLDSSCNVVLFDFSSGLNQSARLRFAVPADGEFTIAASANFDFALQGNGVGTYRLQLDRFRAAGSVTARLVDSRTGQPIPGNSNFLVHAFLLRCDDDGFCLEVGFSIPDGDGLIVFPSFSVPLEAGSHFIFARAFGYEDHQTPLFELGEGEHLDLGDIQLTPLAVIGSLSGRVTDALDGFPLSGDSPHFSRVELIRCLDEVGCFQIRELVPDSQGRFHLNGSEDPLNLNPGTYQLSARAEQYLSSQQLQFEIGQDEDLDVGDLLLQPLPIQILDVQACPNPPAQGGTCRYSALVRNGSPQRFSGQAWSLVLGERVNDLLEFTQFQSGRNGNAAPLNLNIKAGQGERVEFEVEVPATMLDFGRICPDILIGQDPFPQFNPSSRRFLFCVFKEPQGFEVLSEKEARRRIEERQGNSKSPLRD